MRASACLILAGLVTFRLDGVSARPAGNLIARAQKILYGETGPVASDADQGGLGNCAFLSTLAAIAGADGGSKFIMKAMDAGLGYQGGQPVENVTFHLYKNTEPSTKTDYPVPGGTSKIWPKGGQDVWQAVKYSDQIAGFAAQKRVWWHNGFQQAVIDWLGGKDKLEGKGGDQWLAVLGNADSVIEYANGNWSRYWEIAQHAPQSPVTVGTVNKPSNNSALIGGHVYAVEKVWKNADGVPLIRLRNPWDNPDNKWHSVADYDLNLDWKNLGGMSHFVDWNALKPSNTKRDDDGGISVEPDAWSEDDVT